MKKYELHITLLPEQEVMLRSFATNAGWHFSKIAGDPVLGPETKFYLTSYIEGKKDAANEHILNTVYELNYQGFRVTRAKIEKIVLDQLIPEKRSVLQPDSAWPFPTIKS